MTETRRGHKCAMCKTAKGHRAVQLYQGDGTKTVVHVCTRCYRLMEQRVVEEASRRAERE